MENYKRTQKNAVYALLLQGSDWFIQTDAVEYGGRRKKLKVPKLE